MSEKITALIEEIKVLTVLELSELVKALEEEFGVSAAAPVAVAAAPAAAAPAEAAAEKTDFDVILAEVGAEKIKVIRLSARSPAWASRKPRSWLTALPSPSRRVSPKRMPRPSRLSSRKSAPRSSSSKTLPLYAQKAGTAFLLSPLFCVSG